MEIKINTEELKAAVQTVYPALAVKSETVYTKVYEFIYMSASDCNVKLKCCNLTMQIETETPAYVIEEGELLIPGRLFYEIVMKLPNEETIIEKKDDSVSIKSGSMKMKLQTLSSEEFEEISSSSGEIEVKIEEGTLKKMILQTSPFALQDNTRPVLKGVYIEVFESELNMIALEPLKFAKRTESIQNESKRDTSIIIPSKLLESAARVLNDTNDYVSLIFSRQCLTIAANSTTIVMLKLDGTYIDYNALLPKSYESRVKLNRKEFISAAERAYLVARDDNKNMVKMLFEEDMLSLLVDNEVGSINEMLNVYITGSGISINFNIKCFIDVVKNVEAEEFVFEMTQPNRPCVIKPVEGKSFCYLVMPIV